MITIDISKNDIICGIMTGTSLDGIDIAFCQFDFNHSLSVNILGCSTLPFPSGFADFVKELLAMPNWKDISFLNFALAELYHKAVIDAAEEHNIHIENIKLIGTHGQTVWHEPSGTEKFGVKAAFTLQLGNASALAKKINIPVISDFRSGDIALGGQGAPLVPRFDYDYFRSENNNLICLNIGGMANITYLPKNAEINDIRAFDTGPGNVLADLAAKLYFNKDYDANGEIAASGNLISELLDNLGNDDFVNQKPPKSTGREYYNAEYLGKYNLCDYIKADVITTLTHFTAKSIADNINNFCGETDIVICSGGGVRNAFILQLLKMYLPDIKVQTSDDYGIPVDGKEAIAFAYLAFRTSQNLPSNIPTVTGAARETVLGSLSSQ